ncbi:Hypothetical protein FNO222_0872 [Francisella orientalis]|uniref:Transposase n=1 Tax=Francisella orientalis TaxID=299583 RepID=A0ABM5U6U8_9GAMM|nr:hypothetical protein FNO12_0868 [Francisella orientalis FNO12]AKN87083.1 Hypothetical protein FNO24_0868 [Francisella orientalis FNO24]AKN88621.1 Hypothetical protein FNO190_0868 [Francisella orientalis]AKU05378.1 Hypothetical protein FNO01_0868 [Francisella orientalis]QEN20287.1 Hypothetical protein FNO39_0872 [Francisella orientalis]
MQDLKRRNYYHQTKFERLVRVILQQPMKMILS